MDEGPAPISEAAPGRPNLYWRASNGQVVIVSPPELRVASRGQAGERSGILRRQYAINGVLCCT
jgi:hypothetical protein